MDAILQPNCDTAALSGATGGLLAVLERANLDSSAAEIPCQGTARKEMAKTAEPKSPPQSSKPSAPPGPYLAKALENRWQHYHKQLRQCQQEFSGEGVHELRVATRRLLAQFVLLGNVAPSASLQKARRTLKRRLAELGDLRDTQVQLALLRQQAARFPETRKLRRWLERREQRLVKAAVDKIRRTRTKKLEKRLGALVDELRSRPRGLAAQTRFPAAILNVTTRAFQEAVKRRQAILLSDMRTIHQTRVAFKRFRYMVESLSPGLTGLGKRELRPLAYYQRRMGIIQDLEVAHRGVGEFVRQHKGAGEILRPLSRYLQRRRARALRTFLKNADRLYRFWPPPALAAGTKKAANGAAG